MNILITGGAGFIGSHTAERLLKNGHNVLVLDNFSTGKYENLKYIGDIFDNYIACDITNMHALSNVFKNNNIDVVYHFAGQTNVRVSIESPSHDAYVNIVGSINLLSLCEQYNVKRFIFASSGGAVYGYTDKIPTPVIHPRRPESPYGMSKKTVEKYIKYFHMRSAISCFILRYSNVYGPRQNQDSGVIPYFFSNIFDNKKSKIFGDGKQTRDYIYVSDVVDVNEKLLSFDCNFHVFNVGTGEETTVNYIFDRINTFFNGRGEKIYMEAIAGELSRSALDVHDTKDLLSWEPKVNLEDGLVETLRFTQGQREKG